MRLLDLALASVPDVVGAGVAEILHTQGNAALDNPSAHNSIAPQSITNPSAFHVSLF